MKTKQFVYFTMIVLVFASLASPVLAHSGEDEYNHHGMMGGFYGGMIGGFGMGFFGWIFMILIIVALILFIVWLIKQIQEPKQRR